MRFVFEVQGLAMQRPKVYGAYLRGSLEKWVELLAQQHGETLATLIVATFDGLLLDYFVTGDLPRTTRALRRFLKEIE